MSLHHNPIPNGTINNQVVTFNFPDATYTLKSFKQEGTELIAYYYFNNTSSNRQRYSNSFLLDVFETDGNIDSVKFKRLNSISSPLS